MEVVRPNIYADTDSVKRLPKSIEEAFNINEANERYTARPTPLDKDCRSYIANDAVTTKSILNSMYGVQNMNKLSNRPYIVIHQHVTEEDIRPAIIFIDMIASIEQNADGTSAISITSSKWYYTIEPYTDIVRKLFNN